MRKLDFDAMSTACPPSAIRQHCVLRELYKLDITTVLTYLKNISKDDILSALIVSGRMDARQPLTTEQWRMLLMTGKADPDLSSRVRAYDLIAKPCNKSRLRLVVASGSAP